MIIGSLAGPLCAGGGFCAGSNEIVDHQRISAAAYTFSAALPAMLATTATEVINLLQTNPDMSSNLRDHSRILRAQVDPRSDWMYCTSCPENPIIILVFKADIVQSRNLSLADQELLVQDIVEEVGFN